MLARAFMVVASAFCDGRRHRSARASAKNVAKNRRFLHSGSQGRASGKTLGAGRISRRVETERPPRQGRAAISTRKTLKRDCVAIVEAAVGCGVEGC